MSSLNNFWAGLRIIELWLYTPQTSWDAQTSTRGKIKQTSKMHVWEQDNGRYTYHGLAILKRNRFKKVLIYNLIRNRTMMFLIIHRSCSLYWSRCSTGKQVISAIQVQVGSNCLYRTCSQLLAFVATSIDASSRVLCLLRCTLHTHHDILSNVCDLQVYLRHIFKCLVIVKCRCENTGLLI